MNITGVVSAGLRVAEEAVRHAPFADQVLALITDAERTALAAVRRHLAELDADAAPPVDVADNAPAPDAPADPSDVLRTLLDQSMYNSPAVSRNTLYLTLLRELVPDEARILVALSDGSAYPLVHIAEPGVGGSSTLVLNNASTVGRACGVSLPQHTPLYLTRMLQFGLVNIGPEASGMYDEYEMLLTDAAVNLALAKARRGVRSARVIRRTVRISDLGQELWEAAK